MLNALSFDVEEYFQTDAFARLAGKKGWGGFESRVTENTEKVLKILRESGTRATFFVLGWVAERYPDLIANIFREGHEIASHGYRHRLIYQQSREEFRQDVNRSKMLLEGIIADKIVGYRAPTFSIVKKTLWALEVLGEEGFRYDASIFPIRHDLYGIPEAERFPYQIRGPNGEKTALIEFPPSTVRILGRNIPVSGGTYLRVFPVRLLEKAIEKINREGQPALIYLHPWELDPGHPRLKLGSLIGQLRHYLNLHRTEEKLRALLGKFSFAPLKVVLEEMGFPLA